MQCSAPRGGEKAELGGGSRKCERLPWAQFLSLNSPKAVFNVSLGAPCCPANTAEASPSSRASWREVNDVPASQRVSENTHAPTLALWFGYSLFCWAFRIRERPQGQLQAFSSLSEAGTPRYSWVIPAWVFHWRSARVQVRTLARRKRIILGERWED